MTDLRRIDVHHHFVPPFWAEAAQGADLSDWPIPAWTAQADLEQMDRLKIRLAVLSLTCPGVSAWRGGEHVDMARRVNDHAAGIVQAHPDRFAHFATLPLFDIDASLAEIDRTLGTPGAAGVVLLSNYDGIYLGDARFEPIWQELDRRAAVVFIHPTAPQLAALPGVPAPVLDFPFDTTRTAVSMLFAGVPTRHPRVKVILSHAGGFLPYGAYRISSSVAGLQPGRSAASVLAEMKRFYFDTALSSSPSALPCLLDFADPGHVLYGSDIPYAPPPAVNWFTRYLDEQFKQGHAPEAEINHLSAGALLGDTVGAAAGAAGALSSEAP